MTARTDAPSAAVRIRVMKRDRFTCTYCGAPGTEAELEVDHITPVALGGSHHIANLTTACRACNQKKGAGMLKPNIARRNDEPRHGLVGMHFHSLRPAKDGDLALRCGGSSIVWQGYVRHVEDDIALVQLYSWFDGRETNIERVPKADLLDPAKFRLYGSNEQMIDAADRAQRDADRRSDAAARKAKA